jgi:hypothetical protein
MLFAIDIGMVIDSGPGKGRQGVDVVACCGNVTTPERILAGLQDLGITLHAEAAYHLRETGTIAFQCKANRDHAGLSTKRLVEFRPMDLESAVQPSSFRGISTQQALSLADNPQRSGLHHLHAWLDRMCDIVVRRR